MTAELTEPRGRSFDDARRSQRRARNSTTPGRRALDDRSVYARLNALKFPLILLVIYIHNGSLKVNYAGASVVAADPNPLFDFMSNFISGGVARAAVPIFYLVAGFLFFFRAPHDLATYRRKLGSRIRSLLIPYLFWNGVGFLVLLVGMRTAVTAPFYSHAASYSVATFGSTLATLARVFGVGAAPVAYQFWFIRDLMLLVLASPVALLLARVAPISTVVVLSLFWVSDVWPLYAPAVEPTLFFFAGAALAIRGVSPFALDRSWPVAMTSALALFFVGAAFADLPCRRVILCLAICAGVVAALALSKSLAAIQNRAFCFATSASFFVFAVHEPMLTISRKLIFRWIALTPLVMDGLYLAAPLVVASVALVLCAGLRRVAPRLTSIVSGGRS